MENTIQPTQNRKGFTFYRSYYEAISLLPQEEQLAVYKAIMEYSLNGTTPDTEQMPLCARLLLVAFMPNLEANNRRYANGVRSGELRKSDSATEQQPASETGTTPEQAASKVEANPKQAASKVEATPKQAVSNSQASRKQTPS